MRLNDDDRAGIGSYFVYGDGRGNGYGDGEDRGCGYGNSLCNGPNPATRITALEAACG